MGVESVSEPFDGKSVLIVDDDPDIVTAIKESFTDTGAKLLIAEDGNAAVELATSESPDLVILDAMLPRRSGFLVLEKIKQEPDPPGIVMITANQGKRHMAYAESIGVDAYLVKPVPLQRLVETLVRLLQEAAEGCRKEDDPEAQP